MVGRGTAVLPPYKPEGKQGLCSENELMQEIQLILRLLTRVVNLGLPFSKHTPEHLVTSYCLSWLEVTEGLFSVFKKLPPILGCAAVFVGACCWFSCLVSWVCVKGKMNFTVSKTKANGNMGWKC